MNFPFATYSAASTSLPRLTRNPKRRNNAWLVKLQSVGKELVHLGDLGRHGQVDRAVTDLDNETAEDIWVDLVCDLQLLALADVLGF